MRARIYTVLICAAAFLLRYGALSAQTEAPGKLTVTAPKNTEEEIPPAGTGTDLKIKNTFPEFIFFAGLSSFNADLSPIDRFIIPIADEIEKRYNVHLSRPRANLRISSSINFGIKLKVSDNFEIEGELGNASDYFDGSKYSGDMYLYILSSSFYYYSDILKSKYIKPYAGAGVSWANLYLDFTIPSLEVLPQGLRMDGYHVSGSESRLGWNVSAGAAILPSENSPFYCSIFVRYLRLPAISLKNNFHRELEETARLNLSNLYFGLNLSLSAGRL